jgi:hypothetical protein
MEYELTCLKLSLVGLKGGRGSSTMKESRFFRESSSCWNSVGFTNNNNSYGTNNNNSYGTNNNNSYGTNNNNSYGTNNNNSYGTQQQLRHTTTYNSSYGTQQQLRQQKQIQ